MTDYLFEPTAPATIPIIGSDKLYPVNRIFCVGRNYEAHAAEMGAVVDREAPFYFTKSPTTLVMAEGEIAYAPRTENYHYEMELVFALKSGGTNIAEADALTHIYGCAAGLDMTRRDLQNEAKKTGRPWDMGKGFDNSAPMGALVPAKGIDVSKGRIELKVNGKVTQTSDLSKLIWSVPEVISNLSHLVRLAPGDLIMTGTPEGVAAVQRGDLLEGFVEGIGEVRTRIV